MGPDPMPSDIERDYAVGYGKPPRHTRFRKGQSGNPRGRPKEAKNLATLLKEALNEPVVVAENGRRRKITMRQAIIKQLVKRSASADLRSMKILLDMVRDLEGQAEPASSETAEFSEAVEFLLEPLLGGFAGVDRAAPAAGVTARHPRSPSPRLGTVVETTVGRQAGSASTRRIAVPTTVCP